MTRILIPVFIGAALGALLGYFGQCSSGTCPLTSTWWRGAIYGGTMGLLFGLSAKKLGEQTPMKLGHLLIVIMLGTVCSVADESNRKAEGARLTADAFALLSKNLAEAIAKGGAPGAIGFCSEKALPLTASVGADSGATLRRVSHKARNPKNKADATELEVLNAFREALKAGKPPEPQMRKQADGRESFFAPIVLANPLCLKCHGNPGTDIDAETLAALHKLYPQDDATGFKLGELRGMWRVDFRPTANAKPRKQ